MSHSATLAFQCLFICHSLDNISEHLCAKKPSEYVPENLNYDQNTKKCPNLPRSPLIQTKFILSPDNQRKKKKTSSGNTELSVQSHRGHAFLYKL